MLIKILKVLKINLLSLIALPLLLLALASKLIGKLFEKALAFIFIFISVFGIMITIELIREFFRDPTGALANIFLVIGVCIIFSLIVVIGLYIVLISGSIFVTVVTCATAILMVGLDIIFQISHSAYASLYNYCNNELNNMKQTTKTMTVNLSCPFWFLLTGTNFLSIKILTFALPLSVISCIGIFIYSIVSIIYMSYSKLGLSFIEFLGLYPTLDIVLYCIYHLMLVTGLILAIFCLGIEWSEWGQALKLSTYDYESYLQILKEQTEQISEGDSETFQSAGEDYSNRSRHYWEQFIILSKDILDLQELVDTALRIQLDTTLQQNLAEYVSTMLSIHDDLVKCNKKVSSQVFNRKFIPQIERCQSQAELIHREAMKIIKRGVNNSSKFNQNSSQDNSSSQRQEQPVNFFAGCTTEEEIKKRYKSLCKVYHPDAGGHDETFKLLLNQYEGCLRQQAG